MKHEDMNHDELPEEIYDELAKKNYWLYQRERQINSEPEPSVRAALRTHAIGLSVGMAMTVIGYLLTN